MNGTGPLETGEKIEMDWCPGGAMETGKETYLQAGAAASGMEEESRGSGGGAAASESSKAGDG